MSKIISEFLKGAVAYKPIVAKVVGSVKLGILLSQLLYWKDKGRDPDGWIYKSRDEIFDETALSRKEQETARALGEKLGVLESKRMGDKGVMHYRINEEKLHELIEKWAETNGTEIKKVVKKVADIPVVVVSSVEMPQWLNPKAWLYWCEYRTEIKKKMTAKTMQMQINFLSKHQADHTEIIKRSIMNGWQGLFEIKKETKSFTPGFGNSRQGDLARAKEKDIEAEKERRESENTSKNNSRLNELREQAKKLTSNMQISHE